MPDTIPATVVYVSNAGDKEIRILSLDRTSGDLSALGRVAVPGTEVPSPTSLPMAMSPDHRFLYAALRTPPFPVSSYAIDAATGHLTHLATAPLADSMAYLCVDRSGRFLLAASYPGAKLTINPIDSEGRVGAAPTQILETAPKAHCVVVDAANRHAYCPVLGGDVVLQLRFDAGQGRVSASTPPAVATKPGAGPRHLTFHPSGRFAYLITETTATVGAYAVDPESGSLTELGFLDMLPQGSAVAAADLHVTPNGRFLYGSERKSSTLAGFRIDPGRGTLTPVGRWPTETTPRGFAIDPRGRFLLAAGLDSNALSVHAIDDATGGLTLVRSHRMGRMPNWVEIIDLR
jgi:6-phosphogluconolactonase